MNVLTVNLLFSSVVFWVAARIYVLPNLEQWRPRTVLLPILLLHALRHLGLMFLAPGATYAGIASEFAYPAAFGDLLAAILALAAVPVVANHARQTHPNQPIEGCQKRPPSLSLESGELHPEGGILDRNGLVAAQQESNESDEAQQKAWHVCRFFASIAFIKWLWADLLMAKDRITPSDIQLTAAL